MESSTKTIGRVNGVLEIWRRELGMMQPRTFTRRIGGSEGFVKRLGLYGKLNGHRGCVNAVHFNPSGDLLVSGSDDEYVIFWKWATKNDLFGYHSGHSDNVFQARVMPFTDDRIVVTAAADGQVRVGEISGNGQVPTKLIGKHRGRVHKLAIEPGSPHIFYSCGEDGFVQHIMEANRRAREDRARISLSPDVIMHVLRLQRRQPVVFVERRPTNTEDENDDDDETESIILSFGDGGETSEEGLSVDPRQCNIC